MPQANLTYDVPYTRNMVALVREMDEKHWQKAGNAYHPSPMGYRLDAFHSGMVGGGSKPLKYNTPGTSPAFPPHNLASGLAVSSGGGYAGMDGAVGGMMGLSRHPAEMDGGSKIGDWMKKTFTNPRTYGKILGAVATATGNPEIGIPLSMASSIGGRRRRRKGGAYEDLTDDEKNKVNRDMMRDAEYLASSPASAPKSAPKSRSSSVNSMLSKAWNFVKKHPEFAKVKKMVGLGSLKRFGMNHKMAIMEGGAIHWKDIWNGIKHVAQGTAHYSGKVLDKVVPVIADKIAPMLADKAVDMLTASSGAGRKKGGKFGLKTIGNAFKKVGSTVGKAVANKAVDMAMKKGLEMMVEKAPALLMSAAGRKKRAPKQSGGFSLADVIDVARPMGERVLGEVKKRGRKAVGELKDKVMSKAKEVVGKVKQAVGGGRAKRAEIVKRVMAEKGMKMIEASKYVKAHGLY